MNTRHLRAKYPIEQYPVVFTFPEQVLGEPTVTVSVLSGVDPDKDSFAGMPFVRDNLVAVLVVGGMPGVIYKISCDALLVGGEYFQIDGLIAVKDTEGVAPDGSSALPLTEVVTTPPYPAYVLDEIDSSSEALAAALYTFPLDEISANSISLPGTLRELIVFYTYGPEELDTFSEALPGVLRLLLVFYQYGPEEIDVASFALNGTFKIILIQYLNYIPEAVDIDSYALNGTYGTI